MKEFVVKSIPRDEDLNINGTVFGGWTLSLLDSAAMRYARTHVTGSIATYKMNNIIFIKPIYPDEEVDVYATHVETRESEIDVHMELYVGKLIVMVADVTGIAIDDNGKRRTI